jgi:hypothetical protein
MDTTDYTYTPHTVNGTDTVVGELRRLAATLRTNLAELEEALREVEEPLPVVEIEE